MYIQGSQTWEYVIGLEVHAQIVSNTKLFSRSKNDSASLPNDNVDILDFGSPGVLPVLNKECVRKAILASLALKGDISKVSQFDRKNYFYPDLPKGYQISQFYFPILRNGYINFLINGTTRTINLDRMHIEEDAGKSVHDKHPKYTLIDLNRAGVGLLEIVSKPEIKSPEEAVEYCKALRKILMYIGVNDGNLESGSFRCDANVSVRKKGETTLGTRREIKNLNSFTSLLKAIEFEGKEQVQILESGGKIEQSTLLYDVATNTTKVMRDKENANDYRYFPDPDLPKLVLFDELIESIRSSMPELPYEKKNRYMKDYELSEYDADILTSNKDIAIFFEAIISNKCSPKLASNWIITEVFAILKENNLDIANYFNKINNKNLNNNLDNLNKTDQENKKQYDDEEVKVYISVKQMSELLHLIESNAISGKLAKEIFKISYTTGDLPEKITKEQGLTQVSDLSLITEKVKEVLQEQTESVAQYKTGKTKLLGFFVGEVMKKMQNKANPKTLNQILQEHLK